jgi:hypothetical protein
MYHAEPDLWLLVVLGRQLVGPHCLPVSLTGLLKGLHSLAALLHGLLSTQLEQVCVGLWTRDVCGWEGGKGGGVDSAANKQLCIESACVLGHRLGPAARVGAMRAPAEATAPDVCSSVRS